MLNFFDTILPTNIINSELIQFFLPAFISLFIVLVFGKPFIKLMHHWQKKGQPIRTDGPQTHLAKSGTPTMGGLLILGAILISCGLVMDWSNLWAWTALFVMTTFGLLGFLDDYLKIKHTSADKGLSEKGRLILEGIFALSATFFIDGYLLPANINPTSVYLPIWHIMLPLSIFYFIYAYLVIVGTANAVNISDGLDGLVSRMYLVIIGLMALIVLMIGFNHTNSPIFMPEILGLLPVIGATMGAVLGFLWFNSKPASIFMGDVGSLALGGLLGVIALMTKFEIIMAIAALVLVAELGSSFLQRYYYKLTHGKRIFKMAPLHHHFELSGWSETKIVSRFWIMTVIFSALALIISLI